MLRKQRLDAYFSGEKTVIKITQNKNVLVEALLWIEQTKPGVSRALSVRTDGMGTFHLKRIENAIPVSDIEFHGLPEFAHLKDNFLEPIVNENQSPSAD